MRRLKTPQNDYFQLHTYAPLIFPFESTNLVLQLKCVRIANTYISSYTPSQADVVSFKALKETPPVELYPHAYRWYNHVKSYDADFSTLPGDPSKPFTTYGPDAVAVTQNPKDAPADDDEDVDLFGSDSEEEDPEVVAEREKRLEEYRKKKEGKVKPAAKSMVTMDVKPWDDETDMNELVKGVLAIEKDGLVWGGHKLVAVGFGIKKLQVNFVVEDDKVSTDELQSQIEEDEDHVQSTDIVAMMKL